MNVSYYYKYNFISPEPLFAEVKEKLKSYFQTGVIDDLLFNKNIERALKKLGKSSYKIEENILQLKDFETTLPDNFEAVRELWLVAPAQISYKMANSCYEQTTIKVSSDRDRCEDFCAPDEIKVTYKTNGTIIQKFTCYHLLQPGSVKARENCALESWNLQSNALETFEVRGKKLLTNFPEGFLYMVYYVKDYDENDNQLVPDNEYILDYLKYTLFYNCFEDIYNNISDETLKQVEAKMIYYEQKMLEAKVNAEVEIRKQTVQKQIMSTKSARSKFNKFQIT